MENKRPDPSSLKMDTRDVGSVLAAADGIKQLCAGGSCTFMEVCGGHTYAIRKNGLHLLLKEHVRFLSGPGCPVCVTSIEDVDLVIDISRQAGTILCAYGDLLYVPGTSSSLALSKAQGADVRVVYSIRDALAAAVENKDKNVVFAAIGFETTAPATAAAVKEAFVKKIENFSVLSILKTMPSALRAILEDKDTILDGMICPGHVSAITGEGIFNFIPDEFNVPCCISGFEPMDIMSAVACLVSMKKQGAPSVQNAYQRVVTADGNTKALSLMEEVFVPSSAQWRGFGVIPGSGLDLKESFRQFDAGRRFKVEKAPGDYLNGCRCADILRGKKTPPECPLFKKVCTPHNPKGACMVSNEGACGAWYKYE